MQLLGHVRQKNVVDCMAIHHATNFLCLMDNLVMPPWMLLLVQLSLEETHMLVHDPKGGICLDSKI